MFLLNRDILDLESLVTIQTNFNNKPNAFNVNNHFAVSPNISDTFLVRIGRRHSTSNILPTIRATN